MKLPASAWTRCGSVACGWVHQRDSHLPSVSAAFGLVAPVAGFVAGVSHRPPGHSPSRWLPRGTAPPSWHPSTRRRGCRSAVPGSVRTTRTADPSWMWPVPRHGGPGRAHDRGPQNHRSGLDLVVDGAGVEPAYDRVNHKGPAARCLAAVNAPERKLHRLARPRGAGEDSNLPRPKPPPQATQNSASGLRAAHPVRVPRVAPLHAHDRNTPNRASISARNAHASRSKTRLSPYSGLTGSRSVPFCGSVEFGI
jgi:hypothetical protein